MMILALGAMSLAGLLSGPCCCCCLPDYSLLHEGQGADWRLVRETRTTSSDLRFEKGGWRDPIVYGFRDEMPAIHIPISELGPTTGWTSTRGRNGRWQIDAWQVTSIVPLWLDPEAHVHLKYRLTFGQPKRRPSRRQLEHP